MHVARRWRGCVKNVTTPPQVKIGQELPLRAISAAIIAVITAPTAALITTATTAAITNATTSAMTAAVTFVEDC